ncbi:hypothetical protein [Methylobrevis pamukkalensis]|uniref:Uncharacterized protein n=1 Tax=Methylobrevis pamukkalensis TaxID=1439726 RepID=A0A1E3H2Q3_9HYPH|nr:hypothetical protein [Methylobrevis pamukkalensis]ODN70435.1 hypothetical protein A6302_02238 [Methylobrevis pamukkalensis]
MPTRSWPLWLLTDLLLVLFPVLNFIYWPAVLRSGTLSPSEDSIAIPIYGSVLTMVLAVPVVMAIAWLCLRRYNPDTRVAAWRWDRPVRSIVATCLFGGAVMVILYAVVADRVVGLPWYDYLWPGYALLRVPWLLGLRAAVVDQGSSSQP